MLCGFWACVSFGSSWTPWGEICVGVIDDDGGSGGRFSFRAFDHFDAMVASSDSRALARRLAVRVVAESFKLEVVRRGPLTEVGRSVRKVLSNLAQIFGTVSIINYLASSKVSLLVTKK